MDRVFSRNTALEEKGFRFKIARADERQAQLLIVERLD